ncbi:MAG: hypothetical protein KA715_11605 [Xanthomonadaceae bacterium]|nr:hypothetical protein [Xanthomonadaceae bacterium]
MFFQNGKIISKNSKTKTIDIAKPYCLWGSIESTLTSGGHSATEGFSGKEIQNQLVMEIEENNKNVNWEESSGSVITLSNGSVQNLKMNQDFIMMSTGEDHLLLCYNTTTMGNLVGAVGGSFGLYAKMGKNYFKSFGEEMEESLKDVSKNTELSNSKKIKLPFTGSNYSLVRIELASIATDPQMSFLVPKEEVSISFFQNGNQIEPIRVDLKKAYCMLSIEKSFIAKESKNNLLSYTLPSVESSYESSEYTFVKDSNGKLRIKEMEVEVPVSSFMHASDGGILVTLDCFGILQNISEVTKITGPQIRFFKN